MQQILQGIQHLKEVIADFKRILLVCDSSFPFINIRQEVEDIKVPIIKFDSFTPNPLYEDVCKGVNLFRKERCDAIIAVGGGSSMDVAKCIKLYCKMSDDKLYLEQEYKDTGVKLIAIPTTAGTGSESTRYAVIYYDGKKQSVTHDSIVPDVAILEPRVLKTLPMYQKKCTMLDALCQGIESWWSVNSTDESKDYSRKAVAYIRKWWREYIFDNTDEAAVHIMEAANYAGRAICITQTTAAHAFSYKITSMYKLPHGHAVAVCLPEIWTYMLGNMDKCIDYRGEQYLSDIFKDIAEALDVSTPEEAISLFRGMMNDMEMKQPVAQNSEKEIELLSTSVNPIRLKNNPVELEQEAIRYLYGIIVSAG